MNTSGLGFDPVADPLLVALLSADKEDVSKRRALTSPRAASLL